MGGPTRAQRLAASLVAALRRTRDGGKVRLKLKATGRLGEVDEAELAISVIPQPQPPTFPEACAAAAPASAACWSPA